MSARRAVLLDMGATGPRAREGNALAASLATRGFAFDRFAEARTVLESMTNDPPDLLIVDADSPWLDLREFVENLRRDPRTARTLIVALASGDPREIPARREIAMVLAKPINADDAASRLEGLVVTRQRAAINTRELRGDLSQLPLPDLLQLLAVSRASGSLSIDVPGRRGSLVLDNGDLRNVSSGPATGLKAFVRLLMTTEGAFVFTHGSVDGAPAGGEVLSLGPAMFEATRHVDEIARLRRDLPEPWVEIRRSRHAPGDAMRARIETSPVHAEVARLLEVPRTMGALLDSSSYTDLDLLGALEDFRKDRLIETASSAADRVAVLEGAYAAALHAHLTEKGRTLPRVLLLLGPGVGATDGSVVSALGGIQGFLPAEVALSTTATLGTVGTLMIGETRLELYAVPAERDLFPLWAVFGASADAAVFLSAAEAGSDASEAVAEIGLARATVQGAMSARSVADALRAALEQIIPRR